MRSRPSASVLAVPLLLVAAAFAGCMSYSNDDSPGEGTVSFYVKDAPADELRAVFVTFDAVQVHRAGSGDDDALQSVPDDDLSTVEDDDLSTVPDDDLSTVPDDDLSTVPDDDLSTVPDDDIGSDAGWITIVDTEKTIDLKQFQGDARAFLGESTIEAGKYTQIRIMVTEAWGENQTGARVNITLSSGVLKIVRPWTVVDGQETVLTVDFDLDKSLTSHGKNGEYRMKPVLKLTVENGNADRADDARETESDTAETDAMEAGNGRDENKTKPSNTRKP